MGYELMFLLKEYPQLKIIQTIAKKGKIKVHLVGGFLRDCLLNRPKYDFDFAIPAKAVKFARQVAPKVQGAFILLDDEHGCARVAKKTNRGLQTFDFADYRAKTLKGDLEHRDFTINTLCVDLLSLNEKDSLPQSLIDLKGAVKDIKAKKIKMVSATAFKEDPLRLVRAFSHQANLNFKIEAKTLTRIKGDRRLLKDVSAERIRDEFFKILTIPRAAEILKGMDKIGLLEEIMPQITVMYDCKQGGYHHLDVWPHSLETVAQLEKIFVESRSDEELTQYFQESLAGERRRFALMKLAALLHDIGKPDTRKKEEGRISFHGHERVGMRIVRAISHMLKLSTRERHILEDLVLWHLRPGYLSNFKIPSERSIFRFLRDTKDEAVSVLILSLADQRATRGPLTTEADLKHHESIIRTLVQQYFDAKRQTPLVRLINGHDLIKKLKLEPSPAFAKILRDVEEKQAMGEITTKEEALAWAQKCADAQ